MTEFHKTQRAMRSMRTAAMSRGVIALLDIGTSKVSCLVLRFDPPEPANDVVSPLYRQSAMRVVGAKTIAAQGVRYGEIDAMVETERAIRTVVQAAQKMANTRVDHVIACFSGGDPRSYGLAGEVEVAGSHVDEQDVARVLAACDLPHIGPGREVLHAHPVNFALDHRSGLGDPRGHVGARLATDMHMLTVDGAAVQNIIHCIRRCDLELAGIASSAYVAGLSALVEDEQELGAACIDMGGGATGISIFLKKHMIFADAVRMGGDTVTRDIAAGLQVPMAMAERIKTFHGGVYATGMDDREMIELAANSGDWEKDRRRVSRTELIGIMRPRVEEILEEVRARLDVAGFDLLPSQQIVLTGGASQIPGLDMLAAKILGQNVRLGRPMRVQGMPEAARGPGFSAMVGLALFAACPQDEWWDFEIPVERVSGRSFKRAIRWFRDNW
ncbi:cell division protein FtsA [Rhodobacter maris]|uniref:Cell division protein FtsA n=1 Tax=Rhodobacter maris TaxID=446682 RepID=A0A285SXA6_9RHOB|nr:cell division protein FtsA [Rhodobacter maris]SOC12893.1 cell division protein FtsA [Rhodobacter maris]